MTHDKVAFGACSLLATLFWHFVFLLGLWQSLFTIAFTHKCVDNDKIILVLVLLMQANHKQQVSIQFKINTV